MGRVWQFCACRLLLSWLLERRARVCVRAHARVCVLVMPVSVRVRAILSVCVCVSLCRNTFTNIFL